MPRDVLLIWNEGEWRCEVHTNGIPGEGHFLVYHGEHVVSIEAVHMGSAALTRAEILRQRVLRGDLRDNERHLLEPPSR